MKIFWNLILKISGWKIHYAVPPGLNKFIIAVAPHTSNFDFLLGLMARGSVGFRANFLGKDALFRFPVGYIFKALGGIPVDRSSHHNLVDQIVALVKEREHFILAIAPEGTRKKVDKWKTGFYYIAHKAGIPVVFTQLDWEHREINFLKPFYPCGDIDMDMPVMKGFFEGIKGYNDRS